MGIECLITLLRRISLVNGEMLFAPNKIGAARDEV